MIVSYPNINSKFDRFFIKGIFDGDGCLTYSMDKNYRRYTFSIVGSYDLMKTLQLILSKNNVNIKFRKMKSIYSVYLRGNRQIIRILDWLYNETITHLDRKYEKYQDMLNYYKNK
jgi:DNA-binding transcriptional regulator WhiA